MDDQSKIAFFCFLFFNLTLSEQVLGSLTSERLALLELRASLGIRARNWPKKVEHCLNWTGIECRDGRVTGINLSGFRRTHVGQQNPRFAIDSLSNLTSLSSFNASGFPLPGRIPEWLGKRLVTLLVLDLRSCSIYGSIPESFGSLVRLNLLYLSDNSITGNIPAALGKLHSLSVLDLSRNLFSGSIPSAISALRNLTSLDFSSNFLSGAVPAGFGLLSSLKYLRLQNNSFSASIPAQLGNLSSLVELDLGFNLFSGSLPEDLGGLKSLQKILIGNNELEGALPARLLLNLSVVEYFVLRNNQFDGKFPDVLRSMPQLLFFDVSGNNFTGALPNLSAFFSDALVRFNFSNNLFYGNLSLGRIGGNILLDLCSNFLKGLAPTSTHINITISTNCFQSIPDQRSITDCRSFYAERGLLFNGDNVPESLEPPISEPPEKKKKLTYILVGIFGGLGCILILGLGLAYMLKVCENRRVNGRGMTDARPVSQEDSTPPPKPPYFLDLGEAFMYEQMLHATNNFSHMNLIKQGHSGDIFRGTLEGGNLVVIKRADLQLLKKQTFTLELNLFKNAKHPRLVPFIGHCLERENEKILVYKYMPYGDLSNSLYRVGSLEDDGLQSLDWITRLKIARGAAEALTYLHHECNPPLVHRDIQASSILLDDKYEVRLGSLSEVCAQGADNNQNTIARMLWTPQNHGRGPSGLSSANCTYDVYCFGKVLLGLVTGKLGICNSDDEASTNKWLENNLSFISTYEKEQVSKIIDHSLMIDDDLLEEVWAIAIVAKSCLNPNPSRRPLMRHILRALENPFKVVREDNFSSAKLRTSSRRYWSIAFSSSWHHSTSESASFPGQTRREGISGLKQIGRVGSHGSGVNENSSSNKRSSRENSSSNKRSSSEIFPEPVDIEDVEKQEEN